MKTITEAELKKMRKGGVKVKRRPGTTPKRSEPAQKEKVVLSETTIPDVPVPATTTKTPTDIVPMESMASMAASLSARDWQIQELISSNAKALALFSMQLEILDKPKARQPWQAVVIRDNDKLIKHVNIVPMQKK